MVEQTSDLYSLASPVIWIVIAVAVAGLSALASGAVEEPRRRIDASFLALFGLFAAISVVAPDEIGLHGGVIRPRFFVLALAVFAAVFRFRNNFRAERFVQGILVLVFIFQVAALYDYANRSDATARNFLAAGDVIEAGDTVASIIVVEPSPRSLSHPEIQLSSIFAVVNRVFAWDNYEFGYYQFPVFVADRADREFALKFNFAKVYTSDTYDDELEQKLTVLGEILSAHPEKIDKLLMWGKNERIEAILSTSFNMTPIFENRAVRVFRNARRSNREKLNAHKY